MVCSAQVPTWSVDDLLAEINQPTEKLKVINFWATWCGPCIKEMPYFEEASGMYDIDLLFVSLDFADLKETRVEPLLKRKGITSRSVLLGDENYNEWIGKVDENWSGALPTTIFITTTGDKKLIESAFEKEELHKTIQKLLKE